MPPGVEYELRRSAIEPNHDQLWLFCHLVCHRLEVIAQRRSRSLRRLLLHQFRAASPEAPARCAAR